MGLFFGYRAEKLVHQGAANLIYAAVRESDGLAVVIKTTADTHSATGIHYFISARERDIIRIERDGLCRTD